MGLLVGAGVGVVGGVGVGGGGGGGAGLVGVMDLALFKPSALPCLDNTRHRHRRRLTAVK